MSSAAPLKHFGRLLKWSIIGILFVDLFSCLAILSMNYLVVGYAPEQKVRYDPYALFLDAGATPRTVSPSTRSDNKFNFIIWMFGGSTLLRGSDKGTNIPNLLSRIINSEDPHYSFTITNFAVNSFNSLMETKYLEKALIEEDPKPNLIVFLDGANDVVWFGLYRDPYAHYGYNKVKGLVESPRNCPLPFLTPYYVAFQASFTKELYDRFALAASAIDPGSTGVKMMCEKSRQRYDYINKMAEAHGAKFVLFWQPMLWVETCELPSGLEHTEGGFIGNLMNRRGLGVVRQNIIVVYDALEARLKVKPYFVSLRNVLCDREAPAYDADGVHYTDLGKEKMARRMSWVVRKEIFPAR
jgi:hypothetical protein